MKSRGYTLIEMLVMIVLLAALGLVSSKVFITCMKITSEKEQSQVRLGHLERVVRQMRADVWNARSIAVEGTRVQLTASDGTPIAWELPAPDADGRLCVTSRVGQGPGALAREERWIKDAPTLACEVAGPGLTLTVTGRRGEPAVRLRMVSQVLLAQGGRP